jgi:outer membrane protein assembly factor BamB
MSTAPSLTILRACALALPAVLMAINPLLAAEPEPWPQANGPTGNFNPLRSGHAVVDDLSQARLVWKSEDSDAGFAKGSASGYLALLVKRPAHPGSCSGPIVAEGKVFCSSFRPAGEVWAENQPHLKNLKQPYTGQELEKLQEELRVGADDLLIAIDQRSGRTVWKAVEIGQGLNRYMGKREGFGVAPAYYQGRVFSMGTSGRLYAYEAASGKKLWEGDIGPAHQAAEAHKRKCLAAKVLPGGMGWSASLIVAEGVLIVPLFGGPLDMGLRGVDAETGQTRWELAAVCSRYATPGLFRHDGRQYVLAATVKGELRLIDPRAGQVLWTVDKLGPNYFALAASEQHVLVNVGTSKTGKNDKPYARLGAYRITPEGAERAWAMPDEEPFYFQTWMDSCARRRVVVQNGLVYFQSHPPENADARFVVLKEQTGEVLLNTQAGPKSDGALYAIEDRLLCAPDASHGDRLTLKLFAADPADFRQLGPEWKPPQETTTGYEVLLETPYADGCLFMRTETGEIRCYDLRR